MRFHFLNQISSQSYTGHSSIMSYLCLLHQTFGQTWEIHQSSKWHTDRVWMLPHCVACSLMLWKNNTSFFFLCEVGIQPSQNGMKVCLCFIFQTIEISSFTIVFGNSLSMDFPWVNIFFALFLQRFFCQKRHLKLFIEYFPDQEQKWSKIDQK